MPRKIILDTDPGVDDAMAIFLALASPELDVIGLTTIFGNASTELTTRNALALLEIAGRPGVPVIAGASTPIAAPYAGPVPQVHGENGLGGAPLPTISSTPKDTTAIEWMYQQTLLHPGEVTILAVGPLTNLAQALLTYPDIVKHVDEVVVMGGNAFVPGNISPAAEANMYNDPEAADLVFGASWNVTMVGLDVTHRVNMESLEIQKITSSPKPVNQFLAMAIPHYQRFFEKTNSIDGMFIHDPSAVMYLVDPSLFKTESYPLRVETESFSRGKTWPSLGDTDEAAPEAWQNRPLVSICTEVNSQLLIAEVIERLT